MSARARLGALLLAALAPLAHAAGLDAARVAPAFELAGPGGQVALAQFKGKLVYLDFWASWCGPCRQSFPWMNEMQAKYGDKGLRIVGVNVDARSEDARGFLDANPARFTVAFDPQGATPRSYGIKGMPSSVLIDASGKVVFAHTGFREPDRAELEARIKAALGAAQ